MLPEQENLPKATPDALPPEYGRTYVINSETVQVPDLLERIRQVWHVVSSWGRWCDEDLGEWPSLESCKRTLPAWFVVSIKAVPDFELENWLSDLHDRNWIWWSGALVGKNIKIDLSVNSMPASFWMLEFVIKRSGGQILYAGVWKDTKALEHV